MIARLPIPISIVFLLLVFSVEGSTEVTEFAWRETFDLSYGTEPYTFSGSASVRDNALRLTDSRRGQKGRITCMQNYDLTVFNVGFRFRIVGPAGADGLLFSWSSQERTKFEVGKALGWGPDAGPGYALEIDSYQNPDFNDPTSPHIALLSHGVNHHVTNASVPNIRDGKWHTVELAKAYSACTVMLDGKKILFADLPSDFTRGFFRFSAGTGSITAEHWIDDIDIRIFDTGSQQTPEQRDTTARREPSIMDVAPRHDSSVAERKEGKEQRGAEAQVGPTKNTEPARSESNVINDSSAKGMSTKVSSNRMQSTEVVPSPKARSDTSTLDSIDRTASTQIDTNSSKQAESKANGGFTMKAFFQILANVMVVLSLIGQFILLIWLVLRGIRPAEIVLRCMSVTGGLFAFYGAQSLGLTIADLLTSAIGQNSLTITFLGVVIPVAIGMTITKYFISSMKKDDDIATRIFIFFGTLVIVLFGDAYATTTEDKTRLLPNISFVLSVILYAILKYKTK